MIRRLIINADDLGLTRGINMAVSECAEAGMLRSATLMANGAAFDHAVKIFGGREGFGTGIHFVLTGLRPVLPAERLAGLIGPEGFLPSGPLELLMKIGTRRSARDALRRELFAQAEKVFDAGLTPTHFDSHKHVHLIPAVLDIVLEIAARYSIKWIREPFEPDGSWRFSSDVQKGFRAEFAKQLCRSRLSGLARSAFRNRVRAAGIQTPAGVYGISFTGFMNQAVLKRLGAMVKPGLSELMTHPGIVDAELLGLKGRLLDSRATEKELLASTVTKGFFEKNSITFCHFGEGER